MSSDSRHASYEPVRVIIVQPLMEWYNTGRYL